MDPKLNPDPLEMLDPDPASMNPDPQHCHAAFIIAFFCIRYMAATLYIHLQMMQICLACLGCLDMCLQFVDRFRRVEDMLHRGLDLGTDPSTFRTFIPVIKSVKILHLEIRNPAFKICADPLPGLDLNANIFNSRKISTCTRYGY
jgi:hypothetical protein